jgi:uncharacterized membrane protein
VGLFIFTLLFALGVQNRIDTKVYQLPLFVAAVLALFCFAGFLFLIDYASRLLRPVSILMRVGNYGLKVVESVYPELSSGPDVVPTTKAWSAGPGYPSSGKFRHNSRSQSGNFGRCCGKGWWSDRTCSTNWCEPLFNLYGSDRAVDEKVLCAAVAFGSERTMEQDPAFAVRIVVDIALKALSPAINDPTTCARNRPTPSDASSRRQT